MTTLDDAKTALAEFERSVDEGHPWLPGASFIKTPGLDKHILAAMKEFVRVLQVAENAKPAVRVSLTES